MHKIPILRGDIMIQIAIVDDISQDRQIIQNYLNNYMENEQISYKLYEFESGEAFLSSFSASKFSIVFLDIYMSGMDGMDIAQIIYKQDNKCHIIFLTTSLEHAQQSYSVHATYYLTKPIVPEQFKQAMTFCKLKPDYAVPYLFIVSDRQQYRIPTEKILYIEVQNHTTYIHLTTQIIPVACSFRKVTKPLLSDDRFLICLRGIIVNMQHIEKLDGIFFLLANGEQIQLNIRNRKELGQAYRHYMFQHMED